MRNKVEIRAFAVEQVIKMKFVDECNASKVVEEAKIFEDYIIGGAEMPEFVDESLEFVKMASQLRESIKDVSNRTFQFPDKVVGCEA